MENLCQTHRSRLKEAESCSQVDRKLREVPRKVGLAAFVRWQLPEEGEATASLLRYLRVFRISISLPFSTQHMHGREYQPQCIKRLLLRRLKLFTCYELLLGIAFPQRYCLMLDGYFHRQSII